MSRPRHGTLLVAIASGTLLNPLNSSLIAVALVGLAQHFEVSFSSVSWLISVFYLASAVGQPVMGRLGDVFGPRRLFLIGLVVVGVASAAAPLSPSFGALLVVRAVQALGSSAIYPSGMAILRRVVAEGPERARALAVVSVFASVVAAVGPTLGGYLVAWQGWQATFVAGLPVVVLALVLGALVLPPDPPAEARSARVLRGIDLRALGSNRRLIRVYLQYALVNLVFYALFFGVPGFLQEAKGLSAEEAGLVMLAVAASGVVTTPLAARLIGRFGVRPVLIIGAVFLTAGSFALLLITPDRSNVAIAGVLAIVGVSVGFSNLGLQTAMYDAASLETIGTAAGFFQTSRYVGTIVSAGLLGLVFGDVFDAGSMRLLAWCLGAVSVVVLVLALDLLDRRRPQ